MNPLVIPYPEIDPVLVQLGPFAIRWYALAYIAGLVIGWQVIRRLCEQPPKVLTPAKIDDFLLWAALGVILGGRLGYVLFYKPGFYLANPLAILTLWEGGMSFHGGFLGVIVATIVFSLRNKTDPFLLGDLLAIVSPIGLFFGRLANFINGELWGRTSDVAWAMVFPRGGPLPRHPSQLYQAFFEGIALFAVMLLVWRLTDGRRRPGLLTGVFFAGYGVARIVGELFREPDAHLGYLWGPITMGMLLSVPLLFIGAWLITRAYARPRAVTSSDHGARPADRPTHRAHRPDLARRLHGRGARPSAPRLLPHARCRSAPPATSRRRRKSRRCSASFWAPGWPSAGWRWDVRPACGWSSWDRDAAP